MDQIREAEDRQELKQLMLELLKKQELLLLRIERLEDALSQKKS